MDIRVRQDLRDGIATLTMDSGPVNALGQGLRRMLDDRLTGLIADPQVAAIILAADGRMFSAGADIREFGGPAMPPSLTDICNRIENSPKPVIAAIHGTALGGGTELALAAHYRVSLADASIGLPEVTLGLIPGAGGTQRLPRLIGAEAALAMMLDGRPVPAARAEALGLIDVIAPGDQPRDLVTAAHDFATALTAEGLGPRPTRARRDRMADGAAWLGAVERARTDHQGSTTFAPKQVIDCVEAALLLPFAAGLTFERAAFEACLAHPQSRALRHLFLAERRVSDVLLDRDDQGRRVLSSAGAAFATRLAQAQLAAAEALIRLGGDVSGIDMALVELGLGTESDQDAPVSFGQVYAGLGPLARRINAAVMAEGCRLIAQGAVRDAGEVDVLALIGLGYPRLTGGPMKAAEIAGLTHLRADMQRWAADDPVWAVPPLLTEAIRFAAGFAAVTRG